MKDSRKIGHTLSTIKDISFSVEWFQIFAIYLSLNNLKINIIRIHEDSGLLSR